MSTGIFLVSSDDTLIALEEAHFEQETDFQALLAKHPQLLTSDQIEPGSPRRWVHVQREMSVQTSTEALSLDHLYLDQDGIPTLVEVKRAENREARRLVVAQMLDYAANAIRYWPPSTIRTRFETAAYSKGIDPIPEITEKLGIDDVDEFWQKVESNLRAGKIRMLFVSDMIPDELKTIVEFLNLQMKPAIILALELRRLRGGDLTALVPVLFGQTERAFQEKGSNISKAGTTIEQILQQMAEDQTPEIIDELRSFVNWGKENGYLVKPGKGTIYFGYVNHEGKEILPLYFSWGGKLWGQFADKFMNAPFDKSDLRKELRDRFEAIEGVQFSRNAEQYPSCAISKLNPAAFRKFRDLLEWIKAQAVGV